MNARLYRQVVISLIVVLFVSVTSFADSTSKERFNKAERALRDGDLRTAEEVFRGLVAEDEKDISPRLGLTSTLIKQKRWSEAIEQATIVLRQKKSSVEAYALLGNISLNLGDFRNAIKHYRTSLQIEENGLAIGGLATIDFYENRLSDSLLGFRYAIQLERNEPDFYFHLAQVAAKLERYGEAADAFARYLTVIPAKEVNRRTRIEGLISFLRYLKGQKKLYRAEGAPATEVALDVTGNLPIFNVRLNDSNETFRFVLDTGSGMTVISEETAARLKIKVAARGGRANAVGGQFDIVYGLLSSIDIGDVKIANVPVYIRPFFERADKIDGYLGLPAMARFITTLDYAGKRFGLSRLGKPNKALEKSQNSEFTIPIRSTSGGFLSGEVSIGNLKERLSFIIDTGASVSVLSKELESFDQVRMFKTGTMLRVYGAAGIEERVTTRVLPLLSLGSCGRQNVLAAVLDLAPVSESAGFRQTGIIGGNFLSQFRVVFDLSRSVVRLIPPAPPAMAGK
jgi:predicted aspartyl protease